MEGPRNELLKESKMFVIPGTGDLARAGWRSLAASNRVNVHSGFLAHA